MAPIIDKPDITWIGSPNFWVGRWGEPVVAIVDHIMQGTLGSTDGWFNNPTSEVSATFGVGKDGRIHQYVSLADTAWANGPIKKPDQSIPWLMECVQKNYNPNKRTISIEHEGYYIDTMPEAQYQATLALHKWIMNQCPAITPDRIHVVGHYQINLIDKQNCPGPNFLWTRLIKDLTAWYNSKGSVQMPQNSEILNGHILGGGFRDYYYKFGGTKFFGLPITEEYTNPQTGLTEQVFERYCLEYSPKETNPDWKVRGKIIGDAYIKERGF